MTRTNQPNQGLVLVARLPNNATGRKTLETLRAGFNTKSYRLRVEFSGPRRKWPSGHLAYGTVKEDATEFRLYVDKLPTHPAVQSDKSAWSRLYDLESKVGRYEAERVASIGAARQLQARITDLEYKLLNEVERANVAEGHAIDQDIENERLRADLEAIPMWLRRLVAFMRHHIDHASAAWARGGA